MGQLRYLSALQYADMVIGNSSSGIVEAPSFNIPTINIGDRQKGRTQGDTIINCEPTIDSIREVINLGLSDEFRTKIRHSKNIYGDGNVTGRTLDVIKDSLGKGIDMKKKFYDLGN